MTTINTTVSNKTVTLTNAGTYASPLTITAAGYIDNVTNGDGIVNSSNTNSYAIVNLGRITAGASGDFANAINLQTGGTITNSGKILAGYIGIEVSTGSTTIFNTGTIASLTPSGEYSYGVRIAGGYISNSSAGLIKGADKGVAGGGTSQITLVNAGTITGGAGYANGTGVSLFTGGVITNSGSITGGSGFGVRLNGTGTVIDSGLVNGARGSIYFEGSNNTLALENGYSLTGVVTFATASSGNTLELLGAAGAVTVALDKAGTGFTSFSTIEFGAPSGYKETLTATNTSGTVGPIAGFTGTTDVIDLTAVGANGTIANINTVANTVTVTGSLGSVTLQFSGADLNELTARSDGGTGVDLRLSAPRDDFAGTGVSNILWQNNDGQLDLWSMNGATITGMPQPTYQGSYDVPNTAAWSIAGIGDVTGDGKADVVWRNTNGTLALWTMNGATVTNSQPLTQGGTLATQAASSSVVGIGDFNGASALDAMLWRNADDTLTLWTLNGSVVTNAQTVTSGGSADAPGATWSVGGIGDFNGDGTTDVLWRNTDGELAVWTMNGATVTNSQPVTFAGGLDEPGATWSIAGIGDFTGNGSDDVLWRNATNGLLAVWTMDGATVTASQPVTFSGGLDTPGATWSVAGIGDYTGNGTDDVLWRNTSGALALWTMNGAAVTNSQAVTFLGNPQAPDSTWHVKT